MSERERNPITLPLLDQDPYRQFIELTDLDDDEHVNFELSEAHRQSIRDDRDIKVERFVRDRLEELLERNRAIFDLLRMITSKRLKEAELIDRFGRGFAVVLGVYDLQFPGLLGKFGELEDEDIDKVRSTINHMLPAKDRSVFDEVHDGIKNPVENLYLMGCIEKVQSLEDERSWCIDRGALTAHRLLTEFWPQLNPTP